MVAKPTPKRQTAEGAWLHGIGPPKTPARTIRSGGFYRFRVIAYAAEPVYSEIVDGYRPIPVGERAERGR
jgi:hypothetical protein